MSASNTGGRLRSLILGNHSRSVESHTLRSIFRARLDLVTNSTRVATPTATLKGTGWAAREQGAGLVVVLTGDWIARQTGTEVTEARCLLVYSSPHAVSFDATKLGRWDSALIAFLWALQIQATKLGVTFDQSGLPRSARRLLKLASIEGVAQQRPTSSGGLADWVGRRAVSGWLELIEMASLLGETVLRAVPALRGRASVRRRDVLDCAWEAGIAALPIVTIVNVLIGGILGFVGAVQLSRFGVGIYIANLIGIAVVREMAPLMTAIIMSGRTGGAYAAQVATMQSNEEIDALRVAGIRVYDYLILPKVFALICMMPILYLYGCAVGILGGFAVASATLDLSARSFIEQTISAVNGDQFLFGLVKSIAFGGVIAFTGCSVGLRAGRSAADAGRATTSAVVISIVSVIALDALFAVCANTLGI
jgi:phospholipid/cholesterol/gamma-HCH transport system permease protein